MTPVDMEPCLRLAYAFIEPECADAGFFIRFALEQRGGDPPFWLAPSFYGAMMVVFRHPFYREETPRRCPLRYAGHTLRLVRHEEADFHFVCCYKRLAVLASSNFPPEHWTRESIARVFQVYGQVCAVDKDCVKKVGDHPPDHDYGADIADYSAVRVLVLIDNERRIKLSLVVRNLAGGLAGIANARVVKIWDHPEGAPLPSDNDFSDWGDEDDHDTGPLPRASPGSFDPLGQHFSLGRGARHGVPSRELPPRYSGTCRALGPQLFPSVPLWSFVVGAMSALARALSLVGVPSW